MGKAFIFYWGGQMIREPYNVSPYKEAKDLSQNP